MMIYLAGDIIIAPRAQEKKEMNGIDNSPEQRVMVFIDLCNVKIPFDGFRFRNVRIDYECMVNELLDGRKLVDAYVYDGKYPDGSHSGLKGTLERRGFRIVEKDFDPKVGVQKEVDVALATDVISFAYEDRYDVAIIVSGDRDFRPAIQIAQKLGKRVEVSAFRDSTANAIIEVADLYTELEKVPMVYFCRFREDIITISNYFTYCVPQEVY